MFKHPKYYAALRAERKKLQARTNEQRASNDQQASKVSSTVDHDPRATDEQAKPSLKRSWTRDPGTSFKHPEPRCSTKIKLLRGCFTWKAIWCGEILTLFPFVTFNSRVKKYPELLYPNRSGVPRELMFSILIHEISLIFLRSFWYNFASGPMS